MIILHGKTADWFPLLLWELLSLPYNVDNAPHSASLGYFCTTAHKHDNTQKKHLKIFVALFFIKITENDNTRDTYAVAAKLKSFRVALAYNSGLNESTYSR